MTFINKEKSNRIIRFVLFITAVVITFSSVIYPVTAEETTSVSVQGADDYTYYNNVLKTYDFARAYASKEINININTGKNNDGKPVALSKINNMQVISWADQEPRFSFDFECPEGLYYVEVAYIPLSGTTGDIIRSLTFDNKAAFLEMNNIKFARKWVKSGDSYFDLNGDERQAELKQEEILINTPLYDINGMYSEPLVFKLENGSHTLKLEYVSGTMAIAGIKLKPYKKTIDYKQYLSNNKGEDYSGAPIVIEGETPAYRSDRTLSSLSIKEPSMSPYKLGFVRLNAIGGWNWRNGNEEITWDVTVPKDGFYKLAMRVKQDYNGIATFRQIKIDGTVPYKELLAYPFYSANGFKTVQIGEKTPYLIYLKQGRHQISMSAVTGDMTSVINDLQEISRKLAVTVRQIQTITGINPDPNFSYELEKKMPWLLNDLKSYESEINRITKNLKDICRVNPSLASALYSNAEMLRNMVKKPEIIPQKLSSLSTMQGSLADNASTLKSMPLTIDYLELLAPDAKITQRSSSLWDRMKLQVVDFFQSFTKDYNSIQKTDSGDIKRIKVWVSRGREWGEVIQKMADEVFTPKYNIKVDINILPSGYSTIINGTSPLLLSIVSGKEPDAAMGSDIDTPIELAIRGSAADISKMKDFSEVYKRFPAAAVEPFKYGDGYYALPETMEFPLLLYRTDIFKQNNISVPQTWDELWTYTLPKLKQINASFYMETQIDASVNTAKIALYSTFLFQNGGVLYKENGESALDSEVAFKAFYDWTKGYIQYQSPQSANLYNEMRLGTIPIGIGYLSNYLMLDIAAPELYGRFDIAPIPGIKNADGEIVRYGAGNVTSAVIFKKSKVKDETWQFLKWWTQGDTQERFGSEIEAKVGPTARWFSANLDAFYSLPWGRERAKVLKEFMPWYKNSGNVLGGYMTPRALNNAWTRTVIGGMKARDSLEQAYNEISIQIERKKKEYGVK